jgi:hypothetical protein
LANGVLNIGAPFVGNISPTNATENRQTMLVYRCFMSVVTSVRTAVPNLKSSGPVAAATGPYRARSLVKSKIIWEPV